ncbi:MAG: long-chain fatty acid--CoA ligase [Deltaproteobacteria bacterium]|nr:long-chain fatty acid--CoA ligase [Deltaproteobacteria bacterium]
MIQGETIAHRLVERVKQSGGKPAFFSKTGGKWEPVTWAGHGAAVRELSLGLRALGIGLGDRVAIFGNTRIEWIQTDQAVLGLGGVTVPIYQSNLPPAAAWIIQDSESKAVVVENSETLGKIGQVRAGCPGLKYVISMDDSAKGKGEGFLTLEELRAKGAEFARSRPGAYENGLAEVKAAGLATIVYTSGTTGNPKGVMLSHSNIVSELDALQKCVTAGEDDVVLSFLPLAHIFGRVESFAGIQMGWQVYFAESIEKIADNLTEARPTMMFSVPRIYERVYSKIQAGVAESAVKKALFGWAIPVGMEASKLRQQGKQPAGLLALQHRLASRIVFSKITSKLGGRLRFAISGGAPLSRQIAEFFDAVGVKILEGYGLTETTAATNVNREEKYKFGTVGPAVPGAGVKIADDGEILLQGPTVFQGYYRNPEATAEVLKGGWFYTGDIGELDADGFLKITDRKKDLIITAAGKNIAPQNIENLLKTDRHISQVMVFGDRRKYLTAVIAPNLEEVAKWAQAGGIQFAEPADLLKNEKVHAFIGGIVEEKNRELASYETIKKFILADRDFSEATGELTPTLKVKRKVVTELYRPRLDALYDEKFD